ncbi:hypothetical protein D0T49_02840 [Paludibacter sp. 221]|nr:hypothetical protein [Paludibacter sp. 221]
MPMPKNSTLSKKSEPDSISLKKQQTTNSLQPKKETLKKILQFAATYRTEEITNNRFSEIYLN